MPAELLPEWLELIRTDGPAREGLQRSGPHADWINRTGSFRLFMTLFFEFLALRSLEESSHVGQEPLLVNAGKRMRSCHGGSVLPVHRPFRQ